MKFKNGKTYLSIAHGYRDKSKGTSTNRIIQKLGYLEDLQKEYPDPVAHFKDVVAEMNGNAAKAAAESALTIDFAQKLGIGNQNRKNVGYAVLSKIYHELKLHSFWENRSRNLKADYSLNSIMKLLVFSRILGPSSKKRAFDGKGQYFEKFDFSLNDVYRALTHIAKQVENCQKHINEHIPTRNTEVIYYDVTNYYFEIDEPDELRKKGVSKEHRPDPIIQMGLFMDYDGIPISYKLFPGNTNDCETLRPSMSEIKRYFDFGRVIVVADKGLNTQDNIVFNLLQKDGYVYSQTVRGAHKELKDYVLDPSGYVQTSEDYKIKSRIHPREISVTDIHGKTKKVRIDEKQIIFWSADYAKKAKADRAAVIEKAFKLIKEPDKYRQNISHSAAKYVKNLDYDKKTGEIVNTGKTLAFDEGKVCEEEKWDGFYIIVTSELDKTDDEIIDIYRGLWRIEESFKVTKSDLEARPVFVTREDHIQAHFLICFIALMILRLLQKRLGSKFSISTIAQCLSNISCSHLTENLYLFDYADEVTEAIASEFGFDFTLKFRRLGDIKKIFADSKKV